MIQGNLVLAVDVAPCRGNPDPAPRGKCAGFSKAARKRMIRDCARLGRSVPIFVTLTYGSEWPQEPGQWKSDLATWWKRVRRLQGDLSAIWRLEPQERGAPHYHLLIYQKSGKVPFIPFQWVADSWAEITGGDRSACSRVEALKSHRGGMFYAAKYCAKLGDGSLPEGWENAGKHWGKLSAEDLPFPPQHEMVMHSTLEQQAALFAMADAYKRAFISTQAAKYEDAQTNRATAEKIAEIDWHAIRKENEFFGNTSAFFGSGEEFLSRMSLKIREIEQRISYATGNPVRRIARCVDIELAKL